MDDAEPVTLLYYENFSHCFHVLYACVLKRISTFFGFLVWPYSNLTDKIRKTSTENLDHLFELVMVDGYYPGFCPSRRSSVMPICTKRWGRGGPPSTNKKKQAPTPSGIKRLPPPPKKSYPSWAFGILSHVHAFITCTSNYHMYM